MLDDNKFNRKCVGCNNVFKKNTLIRVVKSKNNDVSVDFSGKLNGRGAYICNSVECLDKAVKRGGLNRSLKLEIPNEVIFRLRKEVEKNGR